MHAAEAGGVVAKDQVQQGREKAGNEKGRSHLFEDAPEATGGDSFCCCHPERVDSECCLSCDALAESFILSSCEGSRFEMVTILRHDSHREVRKRYPYSCQVGVGTLSNVTRKCKLGMSATD